MTDAPIIHIAIPCWDLEVAEDFYGRKLGCNIGRKYKDRISVDFWGAQLVCHLSPRPDERDLALYPRHFGLTFRKEVDFDSFYERVKKVDVRLAKDKFIRFANLPEAHKSFFIADPSDNVIEAKFYFEQRFNY